MAYTFAEEGFCSEKISYLQIPYSWLSWIDNIDTLIIL